MADIFIYKPNSIFIPDNAPVRKHFPRIDEVPSKVRMRLDLRTIFFDVFLDPSTRCLIGIGPDLMNLAKDIFPMRITINGEHLRHSFQQIKGLFIFRTENIDVSVGCPIEVSFEFNVFSHTLPPIDSDVKIIFQDETRHRLTLSTLQKDNLVPWISDWLIWHRYKYGVKRLVLYDNESHSRSSLVEYLSKMDIDMDIIFVQWDFPHGFDPYKYCQRGALNHCRMRFPVANSYCINLDIDEYLISSVDDLAGDLDNRLHYPRPGSLAIQQVIVPNIAQKKVSDAVRCWNFKHRYLIPGYQGEARLWNPFGRTKYIYSYENVGFNAVHSTDSFKNQNFRKRYTLFSIITTSLRKFLWECTKTFLRFKYPKPRIDTLYPNLSEFLFLHFEGLTSGWKTDVTLTPSPTANPENHGIEPRIKEIESVVKNSNISITD